MHVCSRLLLYVLLCSGCDAYAVQVYRCASDNRTLFSTTLPSLVENEPAMIVPTISAAKSHPFAFCAASWKCAALGAAWRGMGKEESGGLGEKTRKGKGDCSRAAPLSPGCLPKHPVDGSCVTHTVNQIEPHTSPQASGRVVLRDPSTQTIKDKSGSKWSLKNKPTRKKSIHQGCSFYVERS